MHQSFVSTAALGPGNSGAFNFSVFKAPLKARQSGVIFVVKTPLKAPAPRRRLTTVEQQLRVVLMK